jgi:hypothetical protein
MMFELPRRRRFSGKLGSSPGPFEPEDFAEGVSFVEDLAEEVSFDYLLSTV